eukprot:4205356-Ditylum_brightwellii.AAC.1
MENLISDLTSELQLCQDQLEELEKEMDTCKQSHSKAANELQDQNDVLEEEIIQLKDELMNVVTRLEQTQTKAETFRQETIETKTLLKSS